MHTKYTTRVTDISHNEWHIYDSAARPNLNDIKRLADKNTRGPAHDARDKVNYLSNCEP